MAGGVNVGTAYVSVVPRIDRAAFSGISRSFSGIDAVGAGKRVGSSFSSGMTSTISAGSSAIAGAIGGFAASALDMAVGAVASLGSEMVSAADGAQKFASTLDFAGIDTSTIDALTASTQAYADATVYDLNDIRNVTAQLAANGVSDYAQLAEAAGNLNAVAGGNADTFKSVGMVMTQTAGSGKLMTENWNQLTDAIPGASGALQEAMRNAGAFEGNFREAMENGEISADEFFAAVQQLGMQDVAVNAAKSTSTIEGALGNLKASVVGVGSQAVAAITPLATGAMTALSGAISQLPSILQSAGEAIMPVLQPVIAAFQGMAETVMPMLSQLGSSLAGLFSTLAPLAQPVISMFQSLGTTLASIGSQVASTLLPILTQIIDFVSTQIMPVVVPAIQSVVTTVQTAFPLIQAVISNALMYIQAVWNAVWPVLQAVVVPIFQGISAFIQGAMTAIQGVINIVLGIINGDWSQVMTGLQMVADGVWNAISGIVSGVMGAVEGFISSALSTIQGIWDSAWSTVQSTLSGAMESIKSAVSSGIDNVVGFFSGLPGSILGALGDLGSLLWDAGSSIVSGLLDGIKGSIGGVYDFVSGIGSTIASLKGPIPYDLRLLIPNGKAIMQSLQTGLSAGMKPLMNQVSGIAGQMRDEFSTAFDETAPAKLAFSTGGYGTVRGRAAQTAPTTVNNYSLNVDGMSAGGKGRIEQLMMEIFAVMLREGVM